jgi:hypothetical protein
MLRARSLHDAFWEGHGGGGGGVRVCVEGSTRRVLPRSPLERLLKVPPVLGQTPARLGSGEPGQHRLEHAHNVGGIRVIDVRGLD